jgi:hypothetical protein
MVVVGRGRIEQIAASAHAEHPTSLFAPGKAGDTLRPIEYGSPSEVARS